MAAEKNIRAFLAIEPPEEILQAVVRLHEKLRREISGRVSWTRTGGQHLTLKFFGDISEEDVVEISQAVQNRTAADWSINLQVEKLGVFPDSRRPRILWCGTSGDVEKLVHLQKQLDSDFATIGFPAEERPFRAHLTLARIKDPRDVAGVNEALTRHAAFSAGKFPVRELILFRSKLSGQGAIYTRLATFPLSK